MKDVDEQIDTSDLDLLDDTARHARCTYCQPDIKILEPFLSLCGKRAVGTKPGDPSAVPPNACGVCVSLWAEPCARCGR